MRGNFDSFVSQFKSVSEQAKISDEDIGKLLKDLGQLNSQVQGGGIQSRIAFGPEVAQFATGIDKLKQLQTQKQTIKIDFDLGNKLDQLEKFLNAAAPGPAFEQAASATASAADAASQLADNYARAAASAQQAAAAAASAGGGGDEEHQALGGKISAHYASGGFVHLAAGGAARGTDTVPAMLSPGEFVMNAQSTQRFYSQLVAMNAAPIHRAEGGPVPGNVTFNGGINITASPNPQSTAREVMQMIRREGRRGSSLI